MTEVVFVLVSPARAENVGAAARAMKTMGFSQMRLVNSQVHQDEQAAWVAHGSQEILAQATSFPNLALALTDMDLVLASTARRRGDKRRFHSPAGSVMQVEKLGNSIQKVALVFGCEASGLSNEDLALADLLTSIPLAFPQPSLNLGQAIMLYAYEFSKAQLVKSDTADAAQFVALKRRCQGLLDKLELSPQDPLRLWLTDSLGVMAQRDVAMLHTLIGDIEKAIAR